MSMIVAILTILGTYIIVSLFGYFVHKALHQSWTGKLNKSHMTHHMTLYPPEDFLSDKYRDAGKDDTFWAFAPLSIPILLIPIAFWFFGIVSIPLMIVSILEMLFLGWLNTYVHNSVHINNHWMLRVPILKVLFLKWQNLHKAHHIDMNTNYGIFAFHWDKLFKTFWKH